MALKLKSKPKLLPPPDDGRKWEWVDRDLKRGDIIRTLKNEDHPEDGWLYAWCSGGGFGCSRSSRGNAIFVTECSELNAIEIYRDLMNNNMIGVDWAVDVFNPCRWEKYWGIQVLVE